VHLLKGLSLKLLLHILIVTLTISDSGVPSAKPEQVLKAGAPSSFTIPEWVTKTPKHCFVGISNPCLTIEEARQQALNSAVSQILQAMGAEYRLTHKSRLYGNTNKSHHQLDEELTYGARWFIRSIQQNIIKSDIHQVQDKFVYFTLIYFTPTAIERLRKLTIGPKVAAKILKRHNDKIVVEVREHNEVLVTLTDYEIKITSMNHHAHLITLFVWKVPKFSTESHKGVIAHQISLKGNIQTFRLPYPTPVSNLKNLLLGTESQMTIVLKGHDEIGRQLSVTIKNPL